MVVDTSVLLAVLFQEPHGAWAAEQLNAHAGTLRMSTVNHAETFKPTQEMGRAMSEPSSLRAAQVLQPRRGD